MAKTPVYMPKFGLTMVEAEIMEVYVEKGEEVSEGDPLFSIETEKTTTDIEAPADGYATQPLFEVGDEVEVGTVLMYIADTQKEAEEEIEKEISSKVSENKAPMIQAKENTEEAGEPIPKMRRIIADNMKNSLQNTAQLTHFKTVRVDELAEYKAGFEGVSYNDLLVKAFGKALKEFEKARVQFVGAKAFRMDKIDIGLAVALDDGLIVPAIRNVDVLSLEQIAEERKRLVKASREDALQPEDMGNAVATLTNLGMQQIDFFTPILNTPETLILGVGRIKEVPWVEDGKIVVAKVMGLSLTFDHQVLDGKDAAVFLQIFSELLEEPSRLSSAGQ